MEKEWERKKTHGFKWKEKPQRGGKTWEKNVKREPLISRDLLLFSLPLSLFHFLSLFFSLLNYFSFIFSPQIKGSCEIDVLSKNLLKIKKTEKEENEKKEYVNFFSYVSRLFWMCSSRNLWSCPISLGSDIKSLSRNTSCEKTRQKEEKKRKNKKMWRRIMEWCS